MNRIFEIRSKFPPTSQRSIETEIGLLNSEPTSLNYHQIFIKMLWDMLRYRMYYYLSILDLFHVFVLMWCSMHSRLNGVNFDANEWEICIRLICFNFWGEMWIHSEWILNINDMNRIVIFGKRKIHQYFESNKTKWTPYSIVLWMLVAFSKIKKKYQQTPMQRIKIHFPSSACIDREQ